MVQNKRKIIQRGVYMLKQKFIAWLNKQPNMSELTKKDYLYRLNRIRRQSGYFDDDTWNSFSANILNLIEKYQQYPNADNDISAMKKFNEFLYETEFFCSSKSIEYPRPIMKALSWFPGSETEAPEIRTSCNNGEDDLLTPKQVARFLGTTTKTLGVWRKKGLYLPYLDLPHEVRYTRQNVNALLKRRFREVLLKK